MMPKLRRSQQPAKFRLRNWLINLIILLLSTALMLALGEGLLRWLDGYQLSTLKLEQNSPTPVWPNQD